MTRPGETGAEDGDRADQTENGGTPAARHAAAEGAGVHPLIDLTRDPTPGVADHAAPDGDEN
jgi:hypothetical protein